MSSAGRVIAAARRRHAAAQQALARSLPSYNIPLANSPYTAPGWRLLQTSTYCYKDVMHPWDPSVLRSIREFEPTAFPITMRSTWQKMDRGNPQDPLTIVRHVVARGVRDPVIAAHRFRCEMPIHPEPGLFTSIPNIYCKVPPNWIELIHFDRAVRPYGNDLPGQYLGFNWDLYYMLHRTYENNRRWQDIAADFLDPIDEEAEREERATADNDAYAEKQIQKDWNEDASDLEWKEALLGDPSAKQPGPKPMVTVP